MTREGLNIEKDDMINVHPDRMLSEEESIDKAVKAIQNGVTAFVCAADHQAYDLIKKLKKEGITLLKTIPYAALTALKLWKLNTEFVLLRFQITILAITQLNAY